MKVGDSIIEKEEYKLNLRVISRIIMQKSDRFLIARTFNDPKHKNSMNEIDCLYWVNEDTLYSNYEECDNPECFSCSRYATCILCNYTLKCNSCYDYYLYTYCDSDSDSE